MWHAEAARKEVSKESFTENGCDEVGRKVQLLRATGIKKDTQIESF